jgi:hypothetical protein
MEIASAIDAIDKKITDINFTLKRDEWTDQDTAIHGDRETLVDQKTKLYESKARLEKEIGPKPKKSLVIFNYRETTRPPQNTEYNADSKYFNLNRNFLNFSESQFDADLVLFCRTDFHRLFDFLTQKVLIQNSVGFVVGPEGVGKSVTVSAYLSILSDRHCKITFLDIVPNSSDIKCTVYKPTLMKEFFIKDSNFPELLEEDSDPNLMNFLVIDGLENKKEHKILQGRAMLWQKGDKLVNKLVMICSMAARNDIYTLNEDKKAGIETYMMSSWTLEEFQQSVKQNEKFLKQVESKLDVSTKQLLTDERVSKKFAYTGGSAYLMFNIPTDQVKTILKSKIDDLTRHALDRNALYALLESFDKLLNFYYDHKDYYTSPRTEVISKYVAASLYLDQEHAKMFQGMFKDIQDPIWYLQCSFFIQIRSPGGLDFRYLESTGNWPSSQEIVSFEVDDFPVLQCDTACWLVPVASVDSTYYTMFVDVPKNYLRFVFFGNDSLLRDSERVHNENIELCERILEQLSRTNSGFCLARVFYAVDSKILKYIELEFSKRRIFDSSAGSTKGKELKKVQLIGIDK